MKTWTQKPDGTYQVEGFTKSSRCQIQILREGVWSIPYVTHTLHEATQVIEDAIAKGQAKAQGYRLVPKAADPEAAKKFQRLREICIIWYT